MLSHILRASIIGLIFCSLNSLEAQLFKGRAARQSGGNNSGGNSMQQQQPQQRGGMFQRGRERREAKQFDSGQSFNNQNSFNNSSQQQQRSGLFNRSNERRESSGGLFNKNSQTQQSTNGTTVKQGGLFSRAKERKLQEQNQASYQNRSSSNNTSQSTNSYIRSNQKVTGTSNLFNKATSGSNNNQNSFSQPQPTIGSPTASGAQGLANRLETQPVKSQLPSLVSASVEAERQTERPTAPKAAAKGVGAGRAARPSVPETTVDASRLKEQAPVTPNAQPTNNLQNLSQPKADMAAEVLA